MRKMICILMMLTMGMMACQTQRINIRRPVNPTPAKSISQTYYGWGIAQKKRVRAFKVCGGADKVARVESKVGVKNAILSAITLGIYAPRNVNIYCIKKK